MINTKYIVLIDDTNHLCNLVNRIFAKDSNYEFFTTSSDRTELRKALLTIPDLIIVNEDGLKDDSAAIVCRYIKKNKENSITPIIVISSIKIEEHRIDVLKSGVEYYIVKPINEQYFYYTVKNLSHLISSNRCLSALTGLPGNIQIDNELKRRIASKKLFAILYADLDNFKSYNDKYGFMNGDEVIKFTANLIKNHLKKLGAKGDFLGHIGGDDFVAIVDYENAKKIGRSLIKEFDKSVKQFYSEEDLKIGSIRLPNRKGRIEKYPIMTLTVAMISNRYKHYTNPLEIGEDGAGVKKKAKKIPGSTFLEDRRKT